MLEIAALAFNKIVLLFFYNIKHLKFQSSNTTDHWSNKNTHIDYWVVRMQYQKSFFYTSFNLSATYSQCAVEFFNLNSKTQEVC